MQNGDSDRRWRELTALQGELGLSEPNSAALPPRMRSRTDGRPRQTSRRAIRFAQALAFDDSWSRIGEARRRRGWMH